MTGTLILRPSVQGSSWKPYDEDLAVWRMSVMAALDPHNRDAQNLVEALSSGAATSVKVIANIAANLIAFLAVLAFVNAALSWLGALVDVPELSFQVWLSGRWSQAGGQGGQAADLRKCHLL